MELNERIRAVSTLMDMRRRDPEISMMCKIICDAEGQPDIGHLAHHKPEQFDLLFEECEALMETPT